MLDSVLPRPGAAQAVIRRRTVRRIHRTHKGSAEALNKTYLQLIPHPFTVVAMLRGCIIFKPGVPFGLRQDYLALLLALLVVTLRVARVGDLARGTDAIVVHRCQKCLLLELVHDRPLALHELRSVVALLDDLGELSLGETVVVLETPSSKSLDALGHLLVLQGLLGATRRLGVDHPRLALALDELDELVTLESAETGPVLLLADLLELLHREVRQVEVAAHLASDAQSRLLVTDIHLHVARKEGEDSRVQHRLLSVEAIVLCQSIDDGANVVGGELVGGGHCVGGVGCCADSCRYV